MKGNFEGSIACKPGEGKVYGERSSLRFLPLRYKSVDRARRPLRKKIHAAGAAHIRAGVAISRSFTAML